MMSDGTKIEWTEATWNVITGCSVLSPGCTNCYAMRLAGTRLRNHPSRVDLTQPSAAGPVWTGEVRFNEEWLLQPLGWKRGRRIFVVAHGDLFHEKVKTEWLDRIFAVMAMTPQHTYQVLTKRAVRMRDYLRDPNVLDRVIYAWGELTGEAVKRDEKVASRAMFDAWNARAGAALSLPLPNVWLGVSVEDQRRANERVPALQDTPAAVRWVSAEPLLGRVEFHYLERGDGGSELDGNRFTYIDNALTGHRSTKAGQYAVPKIDWIVAGGESGAGARPVHPDWLRSIRDQCARTGTAFLFKQWGAWASVSEVAGAGDHFQFSDGATVRNVGKKLAGRTLDGVIHDGYPEVRS